MYTAMDLGHTRKYEALAANLESNRIKYDEIIAGHTNTIRQRNVTIEEKNTYITEFEGIREIRGDLQLENNRLREHNDLLLR